MACHSASPSGLSVSLLWTGHSQGATHCAGSGDTELGNPWSCFGRIQVFGTLMLQLCSLYIHFFHRLIGRITTGIHRQQLVNCISSWFFLKSSMLSSGHPGYLTFPLRCSPAIWPPGNLTSPVSLCSPVGPLLPFGCEPLSVPRPLPHPAPGSQSFRVTENSFVCTCPERWDAASNKVPPLAWCGLQVGTRTPTSSSLATLKVPQAMMAS